MQPSSIDFAYVPQPSRRSGLHAAYAPPAAQASQLVRAAAAGGPVHWPQARGLDVARANALGQADTTLANHVAYTQLEQEWSREKDALVLRIAHSLHCGVRPTPFERMQLIRLLSYESSSAIAREQLASNVIEVLSKQAFNYHSALSSWDVEWHVRTLSQAASILVRSAKTWTYAWRKDLIVHLTKLQEFVARDDAPTGSFYLSCLRNNLLQVKDDESIVATSVRFGIPISAAAIAGFTMQGGAAGQAVQDALSELSRANLNTDKWWGQMDAIEQMSDRIAAQVALDESPADACDTLLTRTQQVLAEQLVKLATRKSSWKDRFKSQFKTLQVRPVDNEWDLAFGCLEKIHEHVFHFHRDDHYAAIFEQLHLVARQSTHRALRYKAIEILRDLRRAPPLRAHCQLLLHLLGYQHPEVVAAVGRRREVEGQLFMQIVHSAGAGFSPDDRRQGGHLRLLSLSPTASLRVLRPRINAVLRPQATLTLASSLQPPRPASLVPSTSTHVPLSFSHKLRHLRANEGLLVLRDAAARGAADEVDALMRAGVHAKDEARQPAPAGQPKTTLGVASRMGREDVIRRLCTPRGNDRGLLSPLARREAQQLADASGQSAVAALLRRRLEQVGPPTTA